MLIIFILISVQDFLDKAKKDFEEKWSKNPKVSWFNAIFSGTPLIYCFFLWHEKAFSAGPLIDWYVWCFYWVLYILYTHCMDRYYTSYPFLVKKYILQQCKFWKPFLSFDYLNNLWSETSSLQWRSSYHHFILEFHNFGIDSVMNTWYQIRHLLALSHF